MCLSKRTIFIDELEGETGQGGVPKDTILRSQERIVMAKDVPLSNGWANRESRVLACRSLDSGYQHVRINDESMSLAAKLAPSSRSPPPQ